ncbi:MAG: DUF885 domain-containing protein [Chloroflexi bacterium]|nr:DUF885 domain-containing protein [Chloroflexota bacterium]
MSSIYGLGHAQKFTEFADRQLTLMFEFMPPMASNFGLHEYDGRTPDLSKEAVQRRIEELNQALAEMKTIDPSNFEPDMQLDYSLLEQGLASQLFDIAEDRKQSYDPMTISWFADVTNYIKRDYAPIEERLRKLIELERGIPRLIEQGIALLEPPLSRPHLEISIQMCGGQADYMRKNLPESLAGVDNSQLMAEFQQANNKAVEALDGYVQFLKNQQASAKEEFAIGAEMFSRMLVVNELVDMPLEHLLEVGRANLEANKQAFIETARLINPSRDAREVANNVAEDHPTEDSLIVETAAMLDEIRQYLIDKDIISVPSNVRCKVQETPEFLRWGFAFMDSPGPFEEKATEAYYYVTPVEKNWTPEQKEEWLRRFNYATLRDVSVHEAYPGHYVHFLHAANVMSPVRKAFGSYSFVEGWAHYCEQMMVEEGYRSENNLLRFAQLSEALLRNCRYVVSIMMHTGRMTLEEAVQFFMENAFMEELPAQKEAMRGTFDPGYLNYTLGKLMLLRLREDMKAKEGANFNLKNFHDRVLALGYPPVPLVRRHLLGNSAGEIL